MLLSRTRLIIPLCVVAASLVLVAPSGAAAPKPHQCKSSDLRYPFRVGGPKTFGVFKLRIVRGDCSTAHRVAKAWMKRFEANVRRGKLKLPRSVDGFAFKNVPAHAAQTFSEQGRRRHTTIRFDYRVPNG